MDDGIGCIGCGHEDGLRGGRVRIDREGDARFHGAGG